VECNERRGSCECALIGTRVETKAPPFPELILGDFVRFYTNVFIINMKMIYLIDLASKERAKRRTR